MFRLPHRSQVASHESSASTGSYGRGHVTLASLQEATRARDLEPLDAVQRYTRLREDLVACEQRLSTAAAEVERLDRRIDHVTWLLEELHQRVRVARIHVAREKRMHHELRAALALAGSALGLTEAAVVAGHDPDGGAERDLEPGGDVRRLVSVPDESDGRTDLEPAAGRAAAEQRAVPGGSQRRDGRSTPLWW